MIAIEKKNGLFAQKTYFNGAQGMNNDVTIFGQFCSSRAEY